MLRDVELAEAVYLEEDKTYTIDLDNHTLSSTGGYALTIWGGKVTIKDGSITGDFNCIYIDENALVTLDALTVNADFIAIQNAGTLSILSGDYSAGEVAIYGQWGTVTITTGHFSCWGDFECGCLFEEDGAQIVLAKGSVADVENWLNFAMDVTISEGGSGIEQLRITNYKLQISGYYSIIGKKLPKEPEKGIYIILYETGKALKVMK